VRPAGVGDALLGEGGRSASATSGRAPTLGSATAHREELAEVAADDRAGQHPVIRNDQHGAGTRAEQESGGRQRGDV
jgi:hypothetical protein